MLYYFMIFMSFLESVLGFMLMSSSVMRFKEPVKKRIMAGLLAMICGISILFGIVYTQGVTSVDNMAVLFILGIEFLWFLICSDDSFFVSLFSFMTFVNIYVSISYTSDSIAGELDGLAFVSTRCLIRLAIYIVILPLLFKYVRPRFRQMVDVLGREWRTAALVPLLFLVTQIVVIYYPVPYWNWNTYSWERLIILSVHILFLGVYYNMYMQAKVIVEKYALEKRQLLMAQQEKLWESELARQKATTALASQQKHDMHHHNGVIMGMLRSGDTDQLIAYMKSYDDALDTYNDNVYCSNPIANSILNSYASRAEVEGIKTVYHVSVPEGIGIDNVDLTCVLGNVLENALEGCMRLPKEVEKEIVVTIKFIDHRLRIQVENTCKADILFAGELPLTQKQGGGTGIKSILYTADRYDGTAGFSVMNGKFITQIVLNVQ